MVAAAFAALSTNETTTVPETFRKSSLSSKAVDELIAKSNTANDLLKIADQRLERTQALKIVSVIAVSRISQMRASVSISHKLYF